MFYELHRIGFHGNKLKIIYFFSNFHNYNSPLKQIKTETMWFDFKYLQILKYVENQNISQENLK